MNIVLVAAGGAAGSVLRYLLGLATATPGRTFPVGTFLANVIGCFLIGAFARVVLGSTNEGPLRAALMVGFCGGFTTFSAFSLETISLVEAGRPMLAAGYVAASVLLCLAATVAGAMAMRGYS